MTRSEQLREEALRLVCHYKATGHEKLIHFNIADFFSCSSIVPGNKKEFIEHKHQRWHFIRFPCHLKKAKGQMVACFTLSSDSVEHHVAGECPYREYKE